MSAGKDPRQAAAIAYSERRSDRAAKLDALKARRDPDGVEDSAPYRIDAKLDEALLKADAMAGDPSRRARVTDAVASALVRKEEKK